MSRVPWHLFQDRQQRAHLIVAQAEQMDGPPGDQQLSAKLPPMSAVLNKRAKAADVTRSDAIRRLIEQA